MLKDEMLSAMSLAAAPRVPARATSTNYEERQPDYTGCLFIKRMGCMGLAPALLRKASIAMNIPVFLDYYCVLQHGESMVAGNRCCEKLVLTATSTNGNEYIFKFYSIPSIDDSIQVWNRQIAFAEKLRANGIKTPQYYQTNNKYTVVFEITNQIWCATAESYVAVDNIEITPTVMGKLAQLLAQMHLISERNGITIGISARWYNAASKNEIIRFDKFIQNRPLQCHPRLIRLYDKICEQGNELDFNIKRCLPMLPSLAVQGDLSMTNIFFSGSEIGVLDFDQSGDCCLVSDLILQSATWIELIRQKYDMAYSDALNIVLNSYRSRRNFNNIEEHLSQMLIKMTQAFNYKRVNYIADIGRTCDFDAALYYNELEKIENYLN